MCNKKKKCTIKRRKTGTKNTKSQKYNVFAIAGSKKKNAPLISYLKSDDIIIYYSLRKYFIDFYFLAHQFYIYWFLR